MRYLVSGSQMKHIDRYTIEKIGIPSMVLMERAALAVAEETMARALKMDFGICAGNENYTACADNSNPDIWSANKKSATGSASEVSVNCLSTEKSGTSPNTANTLTMPSNEKLSAWSATGKPSNYPATGKPAFLSKPANDGTRPDQIWVVCGIGNNGADGIATARILHLKGYQVTVLLCGNQDHGTEDYHRQLSIAVALEVPVIGYEDFIPGRCDIIIDGIFGVGLNKNITGEYAKVIEMLESRHAREVIAIDIPSGIHSDTGAVMGIGLKATVTITFGYEKLGTVLYPGKSYSNEVKIAEIGFPEVSYLNSLNQRENHLRQYYTYGIEDAGRMPIRPSYANKGTFGKVLVVAGSKNMSGAAYLSALAAYRIGAGLVKIFTIEENRSILQQLLPEAIMVTYEPYEAWNRVKEQVRNACEWAEAIVLGPGMGREPYVEELVKEVLVYSYVPIIIDADGLNAIAANENLTQYYTENIIITPHIGEMARLTGTYVDQIKKNLIETAAAYSSRYGITCVLKDAVTVVAEKDGQIYLNTSGNSAMAKAGSGDVLTGAIAGLLVQGKDNWDGTVLGVYLHGLAGDRCRKRFGAHGLLARELANELMNYEGLK